MSHEMTLFLAALLFGWLYFRRTGWGAGGMVTPGFLVLHRHQMGLAAALVLLGILLTVPLEYSVRRWNLFGRERLFGACVLSLGTLLGTTLLLPLELPWYGWIIPGLVGAECQRQGIVPTLGSMVLLWGVLLGAEVLLP